MRYSPYEKIAEAIKIISKLTEVDVFTIAHTLTDVAWCEEELWKVLDFVDNNSQEDLNDDEVQGE